MSDRWGKRWKELPPDGVERAIRGDRKALDALVRHYGPVVWAAVAARVRRVPTLRVDMEDLVGEVWVQLLRNDRKRLRYYDPERGELGWFIRMQAGQIAGNLVQGELGRGWSVPGPEDEGVDDGMESRLVVRDLLERLAHEMKAQLSDGDRELFHAAYLEGATPEETAQRQGKKVKTVYQQMYRLKAKLKTVLEGLLADERRESGPGHPLLQLLVGILVGLFLLGEWSPWRSS